MSLPSSEAGADIKVFVLLQESISLLLKLVGGLKERLEPRL